MNHRCPIGITSNRLSGPYRTLAERRLSRHSPIREWLRRQENGTEGATADVLLDLLEGPFATRRMDRTVGFRLLGELELTDYERKRATRVLATALTPSNSPFAMLRGIAASAAVAAVNAFFAVLCVYLTSLLANREAISYQSPIAGMYPAVGAAFLVFLAVLAPREREAKTVVLQAALESAVIIGGPECLVPIYRQARRRMSALRLKADVALNELLPTIGDEWCGRLPRGATQVLTTLSWSAAPATALAALCALERAGDGSAAASVLRLSQRARHEQVKLQASHVTEILRKRRIMERDPETLLRAGGAYAAAHDIACSLLKPAALTPMNDELLRTLSGADIRTGTEG